MAGQEAIALSCGRKNPVGARAGARTGVCVIPSPSRSAGTARVVPFFFLPLLSPLLLGPARCLSRASLVSFGSQTTRLKELNQRRYSSSPTCTHIDGWPCVSSVLLSWCSWPRESPHRSLSIPATGSLVKRDAHMPSHFAANRRGYWRIPLRRSSVASHDDNKMMMTICLDTTSLPYLGHHTPTYVVDRSCLVPRFWRDGAFTVAAPRLRGTHEC